MQLPLPPFGPEVWLEEHSKKCPHLFYASSAEPLPMRELRALEDPSIAPLLDDLVLGYAETGGHPLLRAEIAKIYGPPVREENVLCFPGAQTGIFAVLASFLRESDHCIVVTPCYPSLENVPAAICETTRVGLKYEKRWALDLNEVEAAVRPKTRLIVLNCPNSPTGSLISRETQAELVALARAHDIWIFSDEVYRLLELDASDRLPPMAGIYEKGLSLGVMSKAYGLGGLGIGWVVCQDREVLHQAAQFKHYLAVCNAAVAEIQAIVALRSAADIVAERVGILLDNMRRLDPFFETYERWFEWVRPRTGCVGFVKFKGRPAVDDLALQLVQEAGILVMPGRQMGYPGDFFRIGFGRRTMPESLAQFQRFIESNESGW